EPGAAGVNLVQRRDYTGQARLLAAAGMRAGVHDEVAQSQRLGAFQFRREGIDRLAVQLVLGGREVDEVRVVGGRQLQPRVRKRLTERTDFLVGKQLRFPLCRVLGEDLDRLAAEGRRCRDRGV